MIGADLRHEFAGLRTNLAKPSTGLPNDRRKEISSAEAAWFDSINQFHGADYCSASLSIEGSTIRSEP
jgi:hypothetical protein